MKKILHLILFCLIADCIFTYQAFAQRPSIELTFTAVNNSSHVQMDRIKIMNRTHGGDTTLYWPDTVLTIFWVGVPESLDMEGFKLYQNFPNPYGESTNFNLYIPEEGRVNFIVTDVLGRIAFSVDKNLSSGLHTLQFTPGAMDIYFLTVIWKGYRQSVKVLRTGFARHRQCSIDFLNQTPSPPEFKAQSDTRDFIFTPGDVLLYAAHIDTAESGILDRPDASDTIVFEFATNIPCPGTPTVTYEGQVYNTIQIFSQCWLKENLNVGTRIPGNQNMIDNGVIEKYCYNNQEDSCTKYGGLYQWDEMMQYTTSKGIQGICPQGWHISWDSEWKILEGAVDSYYSIGHWIWDNPEFRGYDAGTNLKSTSGCSIGSNGTDLYGFTGLIGGAIFGPGNFSDMGEYGYWWTSGVSSLYSAWERHLSCYFGAVMRYDLDKSYGMSVRCIRDD